VNIEAPHHFYMIKYTLCVRISITRALPVDFFSSKDCGFGCLAAQKDESRGRGAEEKMFSGLLDGTGEYTLVCEDSEGGRTLVGHLPWK
jgi:hypothetical protein